MGLRSHTPAENDAAVVALLRKEGAPLTAAEIRRWSPAWLTDGQARRALERLTAAGTVARNDNGYYALTDQGGLT